MKNNCRMILSSAFIGIAIGLAGCATNSRYEDEHHLNDELGTSFSRPNSLYQGSLERSTNIDLPNPVW